MTNDQTPKRKMLRENLYVPESIRQPMDVLAEKRMTTKSEIIRAALREYLARQPELMETA